MCIRFSDPRSKMSLCETLHGRRPWPDLTRGRGERGGRRRGAGAWLGAPWGWLLRAAGCTLLVRALLLPLRAGREKKVTWGRKEREEREKEKRKREKKKIEKLLNLEILGEKNKR
jgi:hypothetical protein